MALSSSDQNGGVPSGTERKTIHLPTAETYDRWAATYDSDGNILQALDSLALNETLLPFLFDTLPPTTNGGDGHLYITSLGCGTGRADSLLLSALQNRATESVSIKGYKNIYLTGVDVSTGMLAVARDRMPKHMSVSKDLTLETRYGVWDIYKQDDKLDLLATEDETNALGDNIIASHVVISTLVLEHLEIEPYFSAAKKLLRPGGLFLVTNMHSEMGTTVFGDPEQYKDQPLPTGAGFVDAASNTKIRAATDYAHTIEEVVRGASEAGFELVNGRVEELAVEPWMLRYSSPGETGSESSTPLLGVRGNKWVGTKCWYGMLFKLGEKQE